MIFVPNFPYGELAIERSSGDLSNWFSCEFLRLLTSSSPNMKKSSEEKIKIFFKAIKCVVLVYCKINKKKVLKYCGLGLLTLLFIF
jgi:hypothetical protein